MILKLNSITVKVATEKNGPVASAANAGGRSSRSSPSTVEVSSAGPPNNVTSSTLPPPGSPTESGSSPSQTVLPEGPTIMAGHTAQTATAPTTTATAPTSTPVLAWSPLLFPPWNTALLPAAFYPALRSLPGFLDSMKLPQSQRTTSTGAGFRICNLLELDNGKKQQHGKKRKNSSSLDDPAVQRTREQDGEEEEADDEDESGANENGCADGSLTRRSGTTLSQEDTSSNPDGDLHGSPGNSDDDSRSPEARTGGARLGGDRVSRRVHDDRTSPSATSGDEGSKPTPLPLRTSTLAEDLHARFGYPALHPASHLTHHHPHLHHHHHHHLPGQLHHPHHALTATTPPSTHHPHVLFGATGRSWPYDSCNTLNGK
uniref:Uncharacterized protein n=1 Tax=Anopheles atroparvus TaxID=41427 RepID=A0A182JD77_ANOAO